MPAQAHPRYLHGCLNYASLLLVEKLFLRTAAVGQELARVLSTNAWTQQLFPAAAFGSAHWLFSCAMPVHLRSRLIPACADPALRFLVYLVLPWSACTHTPRPSCAPAHPRYLQALVSMVVADKHDLVEEHYTYNCDSLVPFVTLAEHAPDLAAAAAAKVPQLSLPDEQLRIIANGMTVLQEQLDAITSERQRLQSAIAVEGTCGCSSSAHSGCCSSGMAGSPTLTFSGTSLGGFSDDPSAQLCVYHTSCNASACNAMDRRWTQLDQQQRLRRLGVVLRKEALLCVSGMAWFVGCLTWEQLAQAAVMCWPYPLQLSIWPVAVQIYNVQEQQRAQLQQQLNVSLMQAQLQKKGVSKRKPASSQSPSIDCYGEL